MALDIHEHRLKLLVVIYQDWVSLLWKQNNVMRPNRSILPSRKFRCRFTRCSLFGSRVIRRKPDILINLKQEALDSLIDTQRLLIDQAVKVVKKADFSLFHLHN